VPIRNQAQCKKYASRGGTLVPLLQASGAGCGSSNACFAVTGFGLDPGSEVAITVFVDGDRTCDPTFTDTVAEDGTIDFETGVGCESGSIEHTSAISASGTTSRGFSVSSTSSTVHLFCSS